MAIKVLSLFDGMSVAQQALKNSCIEVEAYFASEIDKYAITTTMKNFPNTQQLGDVKQIHPEGCGEIDLLIGGSPCQDLSIAKKNRKGLDGERSGLFWEYIRIRDKLKPKFFVLENVNSMPKEAKDIISNAVGVQSIMINASLVSAQNRKRLFWVGKLVGDKYEQVKIEQPEDCGIMLKDILEENVDDKYFLKIDSIKRGLNRGCDLPDEPKIWDDYNKKIIDNLTIPHHNSTRVVCNNPQRLGSLNSGGQGDRIYSEEGKSVTLSANGGGRGAKTGLYAVSLRGRNIVDGVRKDILGAKTEQRLEIGQSDKSHTITSVQKDSMVMIDKSVRKLTPIECERLQSMPDNYTAGCSDSQRYKMCGNAFNCKVIEHILKQTLGGTYG
jgi:DNA-cytosine methyltransferase